ncbi:MAG: transcriptional repressor [Proteobacteria bacterium]|nr:transcriptional repressor [Pseudomonadota bacterium]MBU4470481.1 transcriptional repressor [Pseudomonadota bacterium]MCG2753534.1 transcriptional repressor [Desulfobacteraceae bacterium]
MRKTQTLRLTRQRSIILQELQNLKTHPNADEIYEIVRKDIPRISLGTVYRNLEILSDIGQIQKLELGGTVKRFDGNTENHYHIRCIHCNKIVDASMDLIKDLEKNLNGNSGFTILDHRLEFLGICRDCEESLSNLEEEIAKPM